MPSFCSPSQADLTRIKPNQLQSGKDREFAAEFLEPECARRPPRETLTFRASVTETDAKLT
jgi:hypothetical protein